MEDLVAKRACLIGGTGYLGAAVFTRLVESAMKVDLVDVRAEDLLDRVDTPYDVVINAVGAGTNSDEPLSNEVLHRANVGIAFEAAQLAVMLGAPLVHLGSAAENLVGTAFETAYGASKAEATDLLRKMAESGPLNVWNLRLHAVYGDLDVGVIARVAEAHAAGEPFLLRQPGTIRDFVHRRDVADAVMRAVATAPTSPYPLDIGSGVGHSMSQITEMVGDLTGASPAWLHGDSGTGADCPPVVAIPDRASGELGFEASISLALGLPTVPCVERQMKAGNA